MHTNERRNRLNASSEYLQFNWKADLVDSWISEFSLNHCEHRMMFLVTFVESKEGQLKSEDLGKDIASVQALLSKHVRIGLKINTSVDYMAVYYTGNI